ncbi:MAG: SoxR reducing system RseC family protein [Nitrospirae bacterium]|nr:SoxR reducing system RseC family protein [Nitrospirota bacterium]
MKSIVETGRVVETRDGMAFVRIEQGRSCRGCGMAALGLCRPGGAGMLLKVENPAGAVKGDRVMIGLGKRVHLKGYFIIYILPVVMMMLGTIAGYLASGATGIGGLEAAGGFAGLAASLFFSLRKMQALDRAERMYIRRIVRDVPEFDSDAMTGGAEGADYLSGFGEGR